MSTFSGEIHPAAAIWPMLSEPDLRRLAEDIKANGLVYPITLDEDGRIVDGRNRFAACQIAEVEPQFETYKGDPIARVLSSNNERRHMGTGARAMATAMTLAAEGKRKNGRWSRKAVPAIGNSANSETWQGAMKRAGVVLDHAVGLAPLVVSGETTLDGAYKEAEQNRAKAERVASIGPELVALVDSGVIDLDEAERRLKEAERLAVLPDDLVKRVEEGNLTVGEAETIQRERRERIRLWTENVRDSLVTLGRMSSAPVPAEMAEELSADELSLLSLVLNSMKEVDCGFLG